MTSSILHKYLSLETPHSLNSGDVPGHEIIRKAFQEYGSTYSWEVDCISLFPGRETWLQIKKEIPSFMEKFGYGPETFVSAPEFTPPYFGMSSGKLVGPIKWEEPDSECMKIRTLSPSPRDIFKREADGKKLNTRDLPDLGPLFSLHTSFAKKQHRLTDDIDKNVKEEFEKLASYGFELSLDSEHLDRDSNMASFIFRMLSWIGKKCDAPLIIYDEAGMLRPFFYYDHSKDTWHYRF